MLAVGTLEPRKNLARIAAGGRRRAARRRRARLGRRRAAARTYVARRRRRRGARRALPRRALPRLRLALRGLRHPGRRGARLRLPGRDEPRLARWPSSPGRTRLRRPEGRRVDPRRDRAGARRPSPRRVADVGRRRGADAGASTRSSRDRHRRRRARPRAHRGRDLRPEPAARAARAPRPTSRSRPSRGTPSSCRTGVEPIELPARSQELRMAWSLPRLLRRLRPELAHFQHALPLGWNGPSVVTLHDLSSSATRALMGLARPPRPSRRVVPRAARRADHVLAVSERTKRDAIALYGVSPETKVTVTPNGVDPAFSPGDGDARRLPALRRRDPGAQGPARRARGGRRRVGLPLVVAGPEKEPALARELRDGGADLRGYVDAGRARRALPRRRGARAPVAVRGLRAAGARGDGERHAGRRRGRAGAARGRGRRGASTPTTATSPPPSERALADRAALRARRARARAALLVGADGAADGRGLPAGARVKVSAVVVSHGHAARARAVAAGAARRRSTSWS